MNNAKYLKQHTLKIKFTKLYFNGAYHGINFYHNGGHTHIAVRYTIGEFNNARYI